MLGSSNMRMCLIAAGSSGAEFGGSPMPVHCGRAVQGGSLSRRHAELRMRSSAVPYSEPGSIVVTLRTVSLQAALATPRSPASLPCIQLW